MSNLFKAMNMSLDRVYESLERPRLEDKNILEQRREVMYYLLDNPDEIMRAMNDHIDPQRLRAHWSANDGTAILAMLDKAFVQHMTDAGK